MTGAKRECGSRRRQRRGAEKSIRGAPLAWPLRARSGGQKVSDRRLGTSDGRGRAYNVGASRSIGLSSPGPWKRSTILPCSESMNRPSVWLSPILARPRQRAKSSGLRLSPCASSGFSQWPLELAHHFDLVYDGDAQAEKRADCPRLEVVHRGANGARLLEPVALGESVWVSRATF